jgi:peptidoglycan/xylan/chitin deacetylase (PgdA/CDA1 family)
MFDGRELARKLFMGAAHYSGLASAVAPRLAGIGTILMLHRVNDDPPTGLGLNSHLSVTPGFLDAVLGTMKRMDYEFVSMDEAVERIARPSTGGRFAAITLDDAYLDNLTHALPVFEAHDTPFHRLCRAGADERRVGLWWEMVEDIVTRRDWLVYLTGQGKVSIDCSTPRGEAGSGPASSGVSSRPRFRSTISRTGSPNSLRGRVPMRSAPGCPR